MPQASILDGIDITSKSAPRKSIDASWTKKQKTIAGIVICSLGFGVLCYGGYYAWANRMPSLPQSTEEAVALLKSPAFENLPPERQDEYLSHAAVLMKDMDRDQVRELFKDRTNRDALDRIREKEMDEMLRKWALGEQPDWMKMRGPGGPGGGWGGPGGPGGGREGRDGRPRENQDGQPGQGGPGGGPGGGGNGGPGGGGRESGANRMAAMDQRMAKSLNSGGAQSLGLRSDMQKSMRQQRLNGPK